MTHAIISLMYCPVFHCFKYVYSLSTLTIWNTILCVQAHECKLHNRVIEAEVIAVL